MAEDHRGAPPSFHLLTKPTGSTCNLDCAYCFFLEKEKLYPGVKARMSDELLERYVAQLVEAHDAPEVTIAWQGGEPTLMGLEFFRRAVGLAARHARPGMRVEHTIQTNGTKLNGDWARFFKENDFLVGLSIDGPRELHDAYRRDKGGKPTFDRVMRGLGGAARRGRRVERPDHGACGQRRPPRRGLPLPARRVRLPFHPVHPHRGTAQP